MTRAHLYRSLSKVLGLGALWLAFSGKLDALHLAFGVISVTVVMWLTAGVGLSATHSAGTRPLGRPRLGPALRYPFWLIREIVLANLQMARIILSPRLPIDPVLVRFESRLESSLAKVLLGNSITLTPGTFTVDIRDGVFLVHALTEPMASATALGSMRARVATVFGEDDGSVDILGVHRQGEHEDLL